ncbi:MAG: GntR family transcriptional regulator [Fibrobacteres bacterium]|nr:GntR family transcriptional regulator [Fibrobacterota bacterium]
MSENLFNSNAVKLDTLPDQVFLRIKKMILSGELKGGDRIPEVRIAQEFGVSRTPIREALRKLDEYGLISIKPRRYAEVLQMSHDEVVELTIVRLHLERLAVKLFSERATDDDIAALGNLLADCHTTFDKGDIGGFYEKDSQFHIEIAKRTGNSFLVIAMESLDAKVQLSRLVKPLNTEEVRSALAEHDELFAILKSKDIQAAQKHIEKHINSNL